MLGNYQNIQCILKSRYFEDENLMHLAQERLAGIQVFLNEHISKYCKHDVYDMYGYIYCEKDHCPGYL